MAVDVAKKIVEENSIKNGSRVMGAMVTGNFVTMTTSLDKNIGDVGLEENLTDRFDDYGYYQ